MKKIYLLMYLMYIMFIYVFIYVFIKLEHSFSLLVNPLLFQSGICFH